MNEPDIRVLVSNTGDASPSGESANLIRDNLQQAFSRSPVHAKIVDSTASTRKIRDNIVKSLQGITVNIKAELENVGSVKNSIAKSLTPDASIAKAYNKLLSLNGNKASPIFKQSLEDISEVLARDATLLQAFDSAIDQVNAKTLRSVVKELVAVKTGAQSSAQAVSNFRKLIDQQYQLRIEAPKIDDKIFGQVHALKSALSGIALQGGEVNGGQPQFAGRQVFDWIVDNGSIVEKQLFRVTEGFEAFQSVLRGLQVNSGNLIDYSTTLGLDTLNVDMDGLDHLLSTEQQVRTENARLLVSFEQLRNALPESAFQNGGLTVTLDELERIVSVCPVAQQYIDQLKQSLAGVVRVSNEANHQADGIFAQKPIVIDVSINQESIVQIRNAIIDGLKDIRIDVSGTGDGTSSTKGRRQRSALGVGIDYTEARKESDPQTKANLIKSANQQWAKELMGVVARTQAQLESAASRLPDSIISAAAIKAIRGRVAEVNGILSRLGASTEELLPSDLGALDDAVNVLNQVVPSFRKRQNELTREKEKATGANVKWAQTARAAVEKEHGYQLQQAEQLDDLVAYMEMTAEVDAKAAELYAFIDAVESQSENIAPFQQGQFESSIGELEDVGKAYVRAENQKRAEVAKTEKAMEASDRREDRLYEKKLTRIESERAALRTRQEELIAKAGEISDAGIRNKLIDELDANIERMMNVLQAFEDDFSDITPGEMAFFNRYKGTLGEDIDSAIAEQKRAEQEQKRLADESERIAKENKQKSQGFVTAIERIDISKIDRNKDYVAQKQAEMLADAKAFAERTDKIGEDELNAFEARIKEYQDLMQWYSGLAVQDSTKDYVADRTAKFNSQVDAMLRDAATIEDPEKQAELLEQLANMEGDVRKKLEEIGKTSGKVSPQMKQDVLDLVDAMHRLIQSYKDAQREAKAAAKKQTQANDTKAKKQESAKEHNQNYVKNIRTNRLESSNEFWADKTDLPEYKRAKEILEDIDKLLDECTADTVKWVEWQKGQVSVLLRQLKLQEDAAKKRLDGDTKTTESMIEAKAGLADFEAYLKTLNPKVFTEMATQIDAIRSQFRQGIPSATKEARAAVKAFKADMKSLGYEGGNMLTYIGEKMKTFFTYLVSSTATMAVTNTLQQVYENVKSLDTAMTDLRIVTGETKDETKALLRSYNEMAQSLGTTTTAVSEGATDWLRQGYDAAESAELLRQSMTLSIVGEMESADATNALTSAMKGYQLSVEDASSVVDKFFRVDMSAATSSSELALALAKTAANAKLAGLSLDDVIGQLAVVNETMKESGEETGGTVRLAA